ncbi:MAG: hypothetical protein DWP92_02405 [Armatimonadetes bacterium]|nr:MAG: hypothetical protein DWP92_02405 [Armatimonadota bacterium]
MPCACTIAPQLGGTVSDLAEVGRFLNVFEAQTAVAVLDASDIEATVVTDNAGGALPSLSALSGGVRVLVRAEDAPAARAALASEEPLPD